MFPQCNESFLDDVVRVTVYRSSDIKTPLPSTIPGIGSFNNLTFPDPVIDISYNSDTILAKENTISVKQSQRKSGRSIIFLYNIEATTDGFSKEMVDELPLMSNQDHHVVVVKADGSRWLLFSLNGTFAIEMPNATSDISLKISLSSLNNYIKIE